MVGAEFLPQPSILPMVDLVITHGGNNTVTECFHYGKPMILLPLFWDQYDNAQRVHETGFGVRLGTYSFSEAEMDAAIARLLDDAGLKARLAAISARLKANPGHGPRGRPHRAGRPDGSAGPGRHGLDLDRGRTRRRRARTTCRDGLPGAAHNGRSTRPQDDDQASDGSAPSTSDRRDRTVTETISRVRTYQQFIDGAWVDSASGETLAVENPANGQVIAHVQASGAADVDRAADAAAKAFETWQHTTPQDRSLLMLKLADALEARADEIGRLESQNAGKPVGAAIDEVPVVVDNLRFFAGAGRVLEGKAANEYVAGHTSMIRREPVGVVASIAPWNYPIMMAGWKIGPALDGRQHGRPQAVGPDPADGPRPGRDRRRDPAARRPQRRHRDRRRDRRPRSSPTRRSG